MLQKLFVVFVSFIIIVLMSEVFMYIKGYKKLKGFFEGGLLAGEEVGPTEMFRQNEQRRAFRTGAVRGLGSPVDDVDQTFAEIVSPVQDYFEGIYKGNQAFEKMKKGRLTSIGIQSDDPLKLKELTGSGYIGTDPEEFAEMIASDLTELGLSNEAIAGIVGSLDYESLGFTRYKEIEGPGVSAAQYTNMGGINNAERQKLINENDYDGLIKIGARKDAFLAFSRSKKQDPRTFKAFRDFMFYELTNTPEKNVMSSLYNVKTPEEAAEIFTNKFLRPNPDSANMSKRKRNARKYYNTYN